MEDPERYIFNLNSFSQLAFIPLQEWLNIGLFVLLMLFLLLCSAFISASEIAFFSLTNKDLEEIKDKAPEKHALIQSLVDQPDRLLATILIVNNTVNIGLVLVSSLLFEVISKHMIINEWVLFSIQVIGVTALILLFGEIIPKVYATQRVVKLSKIMSKPISIFSFIFAIPTKALVKLSGSFDQKIKMENKNLSIDELSEVHEIVQTRANKQEQKMLEGILEIGQTEAKQVMIPRTDICAVDINTKYEDLFTIIHENGFSRIPVYEDSIDVIKGVLYIKDLIPELDNQQFDWTTLIRQPYFIPETKKLDDLLTEFQDKKLHLAIVVDEYGGVSGLISFEDIVEEIIGEIKDEFDDEDEPDYVSLGDGSYIFDGKVALLDFYRILDVEGEGFDEIRGEAETIAGLILELKGGFPKKGEAFELEKYTFTIELMDKKRIQKIKVQVK